jgi:hypothetical protein
VRRASHDQSRLTPPRPTAPTWDRLRHRRFTWAARNRLHDDSLRAGPRQRRAVNAGGGRLPAPRRCRRESLSRGRGPAAENGSTQWSNRRIPTRSRGQMASRLDLDSPSMARIVSTRLLRFDSAKWASVPSRTTELERQYGAQKKTTSQFGTTPPAGGRRNRLAGAAERRPDIGRGDQRLARGAVSAARGLGVR